MRDQHEDDAESEERAATNLTAPAEIGGDFPGSRLVGREDDRGVRIGHVGIVCRCRRPSGFGPAFFTTESQRTQSIAARHEAAKKGEEGEMEHRGPHPAMIDALAALLSLFDR